MLLFLFLFLPQRGAGNWKTWHLQQLKMIPIQEQKTCVVDNGLTAPWPALQVLKLDLMFLAIVLTKLSPLPCDIPCMVVKRQGWRVAQVQPQHHISLKLSQPPPIPLAI